MKKHTFRYKALLDVSQSREDGLKAEIGSLQRAQAEARENVRKLGEESKRAQRGLAARAADRDREAVLRYLNGVACRIRESLRQEAELGRQIVARIQDLKRARMERMRFGKLKDQHDREVAAFRRTQEQKVTDEFSQRRLRA